MVHQVPATASTSCGRHEHHQQQQQQQQRDIEKEQPQQQKTEAEAEHHHHQAFVTLLINDEFAMGVEVMLYSLREHSKIRRAHVVLVAPDVSELKRRSLKAVADHIIEVEPIAMPARQESSHVPMWEKVGYTSLRVWGLTQYKKVVYIDADALIIDCVDELFDRDVSFAAAPDIFPPDRFNAGVMVLTPSQALLDDMLSKVEELPSHDGGDTGFLNAYFPDWFSSSSAARLSFGYNAQRTMYHSTHEKKPGYWEAIRPLKIIHFCSYPKPWDDAKKKGDLEMMWWQTFVEMKTSAMMMNAGVSGV